MGITGKIFGIGTAKTGTTSLRIALQKLGFNHKTYDFVLSKRVYTTGDYETIFREAEKYDSFEDGPWNQDDFYKQLDQRFPNSKFILTIRDIESWIESHEKHFSVNGLRRIRKELWLPDYDEQKKAELIESHQQRIESVLKYFKDRPKDLLVIDICGGEGWEKLCPFLGLPTRNDPFPHSNITVDIESQSSPRWKQIVKRVYHKLTK